MTMHYKHTDICYVKMGEERLVFVPCQPPPSHTPSPHLTSQHTT